MNGERQSHAVVTSQDKLLKFVFETRCCKSSTELFKISNAHRARYMIEEYLIQKQNGPTLQSIGTLVREISVLKFYMWAKEWPSENALLSAQL